MPFNGGFNLCCFTVHNELILGGEVFMPIRMKHRNRIVYLKSSLDIDPVVEGSMLVLSMIYKVNVAVFGIL